MSNRNRKTGGAVASIYAEKMRRNASGNRESVSKKLLMERMHTRILTNLATSRYQWVGLPDSIDERFLEMTLHFNGLALFYYENKLSRYLTLKASPAGQVNFYDNPTSFRVYGNRIVNRVLTKTPEKGMPPDNFVPIWGNDLRMPESDLVQVYASRLAELDTTIDINAIQLRVPVVIATSPATRLSVENLYKNWIEGDPAIMGTDGSLELIRDTFGAFPFSPNEKILGEVQMARTRIWNEAMSYLGYNNANQDKKERLVADEVHANNDQINGLRETGLKARNSAAELINQAFNLKVSCRWRDGAEHV